MASRSRAGLKQQGPKEFPYRFYIYECSDTDELTEFQRSSLTQLSNGIDTILRERQIGYIDELFVRDGGLCVVKLTIASLGREVLDAIQALRNEFINHRGGFSARKGTDQYAQRVTDFCKEMARFAEGGAA